MVILGTSERTPLKIETPITGQALKEPERALAIPFGGEVVGIGAEVDRGHDAQRVVHAKAKEIDRAELRGKTTKSDIESSLKFEPHGDRTRDEGGEPRELLHDGSEICPTTTVLVLDHLHVMGAREREPDLSSVMRGPGRVEHIHVAVSPRWPVLAWARPTQ